MSDDYSDTYDDTDVYSHSDSYTDSGAHVYSSWDEAFARAVVGPACGDVGHIWELDCEAIAAETLEEVGDDRGWLIGWRSCVDDDEFWDIVSAHTIDPDDFQIPEELRDEAEMAYGEDFDERWMAHD